MASGDGGKAVLTKRSAKHVSFKDIVCTARSNNASVLPKNTDFFDSLNVEHVSVERVWVDIGDDCFSPKSNATDLYVNTMYCNGTHGQVRQGPDRSESSSSR